MSGRPGTTAHQIEEADEKLRGMMPRTTAGRIVAQSKNRKKH